MALKALLLENAFPAVGTVLCTIMYCSPLPDVRRAVNTAGDLGDLNPLPLIATFLSTGLWVGYSFVSMDWWLYPSNAIGNLAAVYMSVATLGVADQKASCRSHSAKMPTCCLNC